MPLPDTPLPFGTPAQLDFLSRLSDGFDEVTRRFLAYVFMRTERRLWKRILDPGDYELDRIRLPRSWIDRHFRGADSQGLFREKILDKERYNQESGTPYGFRPYDTRLLDLFVEAGRVRVSSGVPRFVNLYTGGVYRGRVKSRLRTESDGKLPPLVHSAIRAVGPGRFDAAAIESHLDQLRENACGSGLYDRQRARLRHLNDERCYRALFLQGATRESGDVWSYMPAYAAQSTGRVGQRGGGLQNASRAMKEAAYSRIPGVRNYDLKSSQPRILVVLLDEAGIPSRWLRDYATNPYAKERSAAAVGVPVDTWKKCINALLMGAQLRSPSQVRHTRGNALVRAVTQAASGQDAFREAYGRLYAHVSEVADDLARWHDYLVGPYLDVHGRQNNRDGKVYVKNRVGAQFVASGPGISRRLHGLKSKLAAHLLQGREAAFTHTVAAAAETSGFSVLSHEHDGLVVQGKVPESVVEEAARVADLPLTLVDFVEKSLV